MFSRHKKTDIIAGLDIGSSAVRLAVGQLVPGAEAPDLHIIGAAETPSEGVHRGVVSSIEDTVSSISTCLERAERMIGLPIESVWVGIPGSNVISDTSKGVVAVSKSDGEISMEDVERAIEAARTVATPLNYEILHVIPKSYTVDGQSGVTDPVGMTGVRLEVETQIIQGLSANIKNLTKAVYRTSLDINDLVLAILATAEAVTTEKQKDLGVAVLNIGSSLSSMAAYQDGDLLETWSFTVGSQHITADLTFGLRTSIEVAEKLKIEYGTPLIKQVGKNEQIDLQELGAGESEIVSRKYVADIIEARVEELLEQVERSLKRIGRNGLLPAGLILTGGGAKLNDLPEFAKQKLKMPVSLGYPLNVTSVTDKVNDLSFTTAIGLVRWGYLAGQSGAGGRVNVFSKNNLVDRLKKILKMLVPWSVNTEYSKFRIKFWRELSTFDITRLIDRIKMD